MTSSPKELAEALLQVDEHPKNKFRINLVSLAGPGHEKEIEFLKRVITYNTDGWTWTGDPTPMKRMNSQPWWKGAVTPGSKATGVP